VNYRVLYSDAELLVLEKPSGMLSVPGKGPEKRDSLAVRAAEGFPGARVVHRLDQHTSGVMMMARTLESQRHLGRQFERRTVEKRYTAVVFGSPPEEQGAIDAPLRNCFEYPPRHCVDRKKGRPARTRWRVLRPERDTTRLDLQPETGRSHQIRVHLAYIGHPILGDVLYAAEPARSMAPRLMLHARQLVLTHPATGEQMEFCSPCPF